MGLSFSTIDNNNKVNELLNQFEIYKQSCDIEIKLLKNENNKHVDKLKRYQKAYEDLSKHNKIEIKEYKKQLDDYKKILNVKEDKIKNIEKQLFDTNLKLLKYNDVMSKINSINTTIDGILDV